MGTIPRAFPVGNLPTANSTCPPCPRVLSLEALQRQASCHLRARTSGEKCRKQTKPRHLNRFEPDFPSRRRTAEHLEFPRPTTGRRSRRRQRSPGSGPPGCKTHLAHPVMPRCGPPLEGMDQPTAGKALSIGLDSQQQSPQYSHGFTVISWQSHEWRTSMLGFWRARG